MTRYVERTVQRIAQEYLRDRYDRRARGRIFSEIEVRTKKEFGSKRADGLLVFRHWLWGLYVVSMEAKSYKTLPAIRPQMRWGLFLGNCLRAGLVITILSGTFFFLFKEGLGKIQYQLPLTVFFSGTVLYGILTRKSYSHRVAEVVDQVGQYPANEKWLAFSDDSLKDISKVRRRQLKKICQNRGIGILIVRDRGKVKEWIRPKKRPKLWGDYLRYYSVEDELRRMFNR